MPIKKLRPSYDFVDDRLEQLKHIVPEAFKDGRMDWESLQEALGEYLEDAQVEHFGLNWPGKREAGRSAAQPSEGTLIPVIGEGLNEETTQNIFIEGDNLEVLKLLYKSYAGLVKMIYIDPPYNTGGDFVYKDNYHDPIGEYRRKIGQIDAEGIQQTSNKKSDGRFHSNWLSMIYPRLLLARQLLRDDGVIFISIDDNEVHNLRQVMNEVFGEENFFAQIIVRSNSRGQTYKQIAKTHEYLLLYTKNPETELFELEKEGEKDDLNLSDDLGNFNIRELRNRNPKFGKHNRPNLYYPFYVNVSAPDQDGFFPISLEKTSAYHVEVLPLNSAGKESCWRWGKELAQANIHENTLKSNVVAKRKTSGTFGIYEKYRKTTYKPKSIWTENGFLTETGTVELGDLGLSEFFDFPKPIALIKQCLELSTDSEDIVLDFFAGSCTTADAVLRLNTQNRQNRHLIMVQLPEPLDKPEFKNLAELGKERIRKVIQQLESNESQSDTASEENVDLGFRCYRLDTSNFKRWQAYQGENVEELERQLDMFETPLIDGWKEYDLLVEVMLLEGFALDSSVSQVDDYYDNVIYLIESDYHEHRLFVCLDKAVKGSTIDRVQLEDRDIFICLDSALSDQSKMRLSDQANLHVI